jgi:hypothetical protein
VAEIGDLANSGVRRLKSPSIGCSKSRGARTRSGEKIRSRPSEEDRCRDQRSRELGSSQGESQKSRDTRSRSSEVARG